MLRQHRSISASSHGTCCRRVSPVRCLPTSTAQTSCSFTTPLHRCSATSGERHPAPVQVGAILGPRGQGPWSGAASARASRIRRDRRCVPHIKARTRADVTYAVGWATAQDRGLFMETTRYPARFAILDAPGLNALALVDIVARFEPSAQTERFIANQRRRVLRARQARATGAQGRRGLRHRHQRLLPAGGQRQRQAVDVQRRGRRHRAAWPGLRSRRRRRGAQLTAARRLADSAGRSRRRGVAGPAPAPGPGDPSHHERRFPYAPRARAAWLRRRGSRLAPASRQRGQQRCSGARASASKPCSWAASARPPATRWP